jgi:hypothetical protein
LRVGKTETLLDLGDGQADVAAGLFVPVDWSIDWRPWLPLSEKSYTTAVQLFFEAGGFGFAAGIEDLSNGGSAMGVTRYNDDNTSAHLAAAYFEETVDGNEAGWGVHAGVDSDFGVASFVTAIAYDSAHYWNGLSSGTISLGSFDLTATGQATQDGHRTLGTSVGIRLSEAVILTANAQRLWEEEGASANLISTGITIDVGDDLQVSAEVGDIGGDYPARYMMAEGKVDMTSGFGAHVRGVVTSDGGFKIESSIVQRLR